MTIKFLKQSRSPKLWNLLFVSTTPSLFFYELLSYLLMDEHYFANHLIYFHLLSSVQVRFGLVQLENKPPSSHVNHCGPLCIVIMEPLAS